MVIYKVNSEERKGQQQNIMVHDCNYFWRRLNYKNYLHYLDGMNMKTRRYNNEHDCFIALTYHLKLNKW